MKTNDIDILAITETRQLMQLGRESKHYWYVQSPPSGTGESLAQGVLLIIAKTKCVQAQPVLQSLHSRTLITALLHFKSQGDEIRKTIVSAYYARPSEKQSCDEKLKMMLGGLSQRYLRDATIVLGDFNRPREEVTDLLADSNIHPAPRPLAPN